MAAEPSPGGPSGGPTLIFRNPRRVGLAAAGAFTLSALLFLCAGFTFLLLLITPPTEKSSMMPGLIGGMMVVPLFALLYGIMQLKSPLRAAIDDDGLSAEWLIARRRLPWSQIARVRRDKINPLAADSIFKSAHKRRAQDVLVLLDERGKELARLTSALSDFPLLVAEIERRSSMARGTPTYDRAGEVSTRRKRARRTSALAAVFGAFLAVGALAGSIFVVREHRAAARLQTEGVPAEARVTRHYLYNVTPRLEYAFTDPHGAEHTRDATLTREAWEALRSKPTVPIVYLPADPDRSRLALGEVNEFDLPLPLALGAFALAGLMGLLFVAARLLGIADIKVKDGRVRLLRFDDLGDELEEGPAPGSAEAAAAATRAPIAGPDLAVARAGGTGTGATLAPGAGAGAGTGGGGITAMAVLNLVFGIGAAGLNALRLALVVWVASQGGSRVIDTPQGPIELSLTLLPIIAQSCGLVLGILLLVSGIGLLLRRRWGRTLALIAAAGQCALGLVWIANAFINPLPPLVTEDEAQVSRIPLEQIGAVSFLLLGMVYPVVVLVVLGSRSARDRLRA